LDVLRTRVKGFLKEIKFLVSLEKLDIIPRRKNLDSLSRLGLTVRDVPKEILSLQVSDYHKGPELDEGREGNVWFFGKEIRKVEVYIKLKTYKVGIESFAKCISFHPAEFKITYPLRDSAKGEDE
jgi:hypothetical protein